MSNKLKILSGMSGMQKLVLSEETEKEALENLGIPQLKARLAELSPDDTATSDIIKTIITNKEVAKKAQIETSKENLAGAETYEHAKSRMSIPQAVEATLKHADVEGDTSFVEAEAKRRLAEIDNHISRLEDKLNVSASSNLELEIRDLSSIVEKDINKLGRLDKTITRDDSQEEASAKRIAEKSATNLRLAIKRNKEKLSNFKDLEKLYSQRENSKKSTETFNERDIKKAKARAAHAKGRAMGKSRAAIAVSTLGLQDTTSLVYKENPATSDLEQTSSTFASMYKLALSQSGKSGQVGQTYKSFQAAITSDNAIFKSLAEAILEALGSKKNHLINTNPELQNVFSNLSRGQGIQLNSDLIKICWIFFAGEEALASAKTNQNFITTLTKLEQAQPLKSITNPIDSIETLNNLFVSEELTNLFQTVKSNLTHEEQEKISNNSNNILTGSKTLYDNTYNNKRYNVADTIYYNIINSMGSPEDKIRLLKNVGSSDKFLAPEAVKELDRVRDSMEDRLYGNLKNPSKGQDYERGSLIKGRYELQGRKASMLSRSLSNIVKATPQASQVETLVNNEIGMTMDFTGETQEALRQLFTSENFTVQTLISVLRGRFNYILNRPKGLLKYKENYENLLKNPSSKTPAHEIEEKITAYDQAIQSLNKFFNDFIKDVQALQPEDLKRLARIFSSSITPPKQKNEAGGINKALINTESEDGQAVLEYLDAVVSAINSETIQTGKETNYTSKTPELRKEIKEQEDILTQLNKELKKNNTASIKDEIETLTSAIEDLKEDLSDSEISDTQAAYPITDKGGLVERDKTKAKAQKAEEAIKKLLAYTDETKVINAETLQQIISKLPDEITNTISINLAANVLTILDNTLETFSTSTDEDVEEWEDKARMVLKNTNDYLRTPELSSNAPEAVARNNAFQRLLLPVKQELEDLSKAAWYSDQNHLTDKQKAKQKISKESKRLERLKKDLYTEILKFVRSKDLDQTEKENLFSGNEYFSEDLTDLINNFKAEHASESDSTIIDNLLKTTTFDNIVSDTGSKNIDTFSPEQEDENTKASRRDIIASEYSLIPGSALRGKPSIMRTRELDRYLFRRNFESLNEKAKTFYAEVEKLVRKYKLYSKNLSWVGDESSTDYADFLDDLVDLVASFKSNLATDSSAAALETNEFLEGLLGEDELNLDKSTKVGNKLLSKTTTTLDLNVVKDKIKASLPFENLTDLIDNAVQTGTIAWPTKKIVAPVVNLGSGGTLGLKSATILNLMSSLKNYESPTTFDISLNKTGEDILSSLLNTKKYNGKFKAWPELGLVMQIYFLINLKNTVKASDLINKFSGDFIKVDIDISGEDAISKSLKNSLDNLNKVFQATVVSEFITDFGDGGTLDIAINNGIKQLREIVKATGDTIPLIKHGTVTSIPFPKDDQEAYGLLESLGGTDTLTFAETGNAFKASNISSPAMEKMLALLLDENTQPLVKTLSDCITIVKNALSFTCGDEITKALAKHKAFDSSTGKIDSVAMNGAIEEYRRNEDFIAFTAKFRTFDDKDLDLQITEVVPEDSKSKQGFSNIKQVFLSSFLIDFTWEAITDSISETYIDEVVGEAERSSELPANYKEVEDESPVFVSGLFEKSSIKTNSDVEQLKQHINVLQQELTDNESATEDKLSKEDIAQIQTTIDNLKDNLDSKVASFTSPLGQAAISSKESAAASAQKRFKGSGILPTNTQVPTTTDLEGNIVIHLNPKIATNTFTNVTKVINAGRKKGLRTGEVKKKGAGSNRPSKDAGRISYIEIKPIGQTLDDFAKGLELTSSILSKVYLEDSEQLSKYSQSISASIPEVKKAINAVAASPFAPGIQADVTRYLSGIPAIQKPLIPLLIDPATAIKEAKDSFDDDGVFSSVFSFADSVAKDIIAKDTTLNLVIDTLNSLISAENKDNTLATNLDYVKSMPKKATPKVRTKELDPADINTFTYNFFTSTMTNDTAIKLLHAVKKNLIDFIPTLYSPEEHATRKAAKLNALKSSKVGAEKEVEAIRAQIDKIPGANIPEQQDAVFASEPANSLRHKLVKYQQIANDADKEIATLGVSTTAPNNNNKQNKMVNFLKALYTRGELLRNKYIEKLAKEQLPKNKAVIYQQEITPLHNKVSIVQDFVSKLSTDFGDSNELDKVFKDFSILNSELGKIPIPVKEDIGLHAMLNFNRLLQEAEEGELMDENPSEDFTLAPVKKKTEAEVNAEVTETEATLAQIKTERDALKSNDINTLSKEQRKQLAELETDYTETYQNLTKLRNAYFTDQRPYLLDMAKELISLGLTPATYVSATSGKVSHRVNMITDSIKAAIVINLAKDTKFALLRNVLNCPLYMGISVQLPKMDRIQEKLHITDFYSMKMFASLDKRYILNYVEKEQ